MLELNVRKVRVWADDIGAPDLNLAELDYRLTSLLKGIMSDSRSSTALCLKGGTAINKLYLAERARLSVDLDFNHLGPKEVVMNERRSLRDGLRSLASEQDDYDISTDYNYERTHLLLRYRTVTNSPGQIKLEITHIERFPILPIERRRTLSPDDEEFAVKVLSLEELLATKLRALYERFTARDFYDLFFSLAEFRIDKKATRKMFLYYFYRSGKEFEPVPYFGRLREIEAEGAVEDDVSNLLRPGLRFDLPSVVKDVLKGIAFLQDLDSDDSDFLHLARTLLGKRAVPRARKRQIAAIDYPIKSLMRGLAITPEAEAIHVDDIRLHRVSPQQ